METVIFTIRKITSNFGGLYSISTNDCKVGTYNMSDIDCLHLFETMDEITEDYNIKGYAVLFEVD